MPRSIQLPAVLQDALALGASTLGAATSGVVSSTSSTGSAVWSSACPVTTTPITARQQNAGLELMLRNSDHIDDLWYRNELNISKIRACDAHIAELYANLEVKLASLTRLNNAMESLKEIAAQVDKSRQLVTKVEQQLDDCAAAMLIMDDTREMVETKRREAAEREMRNRQLQEERRKIFEEQFNSDLLRFKETGEVAAPLCQLASPGDLSEISLEQDEDEQQALCRFLESSGEHESLDEEQDCDLAKTSQSHRDQETPQQQLEQQQWREPVQQRAVLLTQDLSKTCDDHDL